VLRHAGIYFLFRAGNGVVALLSLMLLTRWLPADQYGRYALGISGANVIAALGFQWLSVSVGRFHSSKEIGPGRLFDTARRCAWVVGAAVLAVALLLVALDWPASGSAGFVLTVAALGVTLGMHGLHLQFLNSRQDALRYGWLTASRSWLALALCLAAVWGGGLATAALAGSLVGSAAALALLGARKAGPQDEGTSARAAVAPELLRFGLPLSLTYLSITILDASDRFMLNHWHGTAAVAAYGAAFDLIQQILGAVLNVLYLAAYPRVIAAWERGGIDAAKAALAPLRKATLTLAPLGALLFAGLAPDIAALMLGPQVAAQAAAVMPAVAVAVACSGMRAFCFDIALHLRRATRLHVTTTALMAGLNLMLNLALIPRFGAWGAAIASAAAFGLGAGLSLWFGRLDRLFDNIGVDFARSAVAVLAGWFCIQVVRSQLLALPPDSLVDAVPIRLPLCALAGIAGYLGIHEFARFIQQRHP
jgi:O-antigen/teichoic acid export membrane protein